ncbi:hypothetical protein A2U01_0071363, partial [Trifolium medium]|nr:hypothetical protein [Trifolium medium]
ARSNVGGAQVTFEGRKEASQAKSQTVPTGGGREDQNRDPKVVQRQVHPNNQVCRIGF